MNDEDGFLRKLLENPADDTTRLVYADWLDERDDAESSAKSQFLRLTVRMLDPKRPKGNDKQLQKLAAGLNTDWLAVVSRLEVDNCGEKHAAQRRSGSQPSFFEFICDKRWDELTPTDNATVRFCDRCKEDVHYCDTITEAREHAQKGHCVAVDLGITRCQYDLNPPLSYVGRPSPELLREEKKRCGVDKVSQVREQAKRQRQGDPDPA
jgi:uncharacterized protein (TIGR02996 family)